MLMSLDLNVSDGTKELASIENISRNLGLISDVLEKVGKENYPTVLCLIKHFFSSLRTRSGDDHVSSLTLFFLALRRNNIARSHESRII